MNAVAIAVRTFASTPQPLLFWSVAVRNFSAEFAGLESQGLGRRQTGGHRRRIQHGRDIAPLEAILGLCERFDAALLVDDAHGFGVLGREGRGVLAHFGLDSPRIVCVGTLGKAAGVSGAFVAGSVDLIEMLIQRSRSYFYMASPPALACALMKSLELIEAESWRRRRLEALEKRLARAPRRQRWQLARSQTPIQPLIIGGSRETVAVSGALAREGILVPAIRPPTVPADTTRLRISPSVAHSEEDVGRLEDALQRAEQASW